MRSLVPLAALALCSCATIVASGPDLIPVTTDPPGAKVYIGDSPAPIAVTPATLSIRRQDGEYLDFWDGYGVRLRFEHEGCHPQVVMVHDVLNGWYVGNFLFGGAIGMLIDMATGNATKWPERPLHVPLTPVTAAVPDMLDARNLYGHSATLAASAKTKQTPTHEEIW